MYLYKEMIYGYKECFKADELSLITNKIARGRPPKYK
uniref:AT hook containing protein n=1 Tax=Siphoviridae sp. ctES717 TaxID=2827564 RepID=A0A8S5RS65_9CAUD|nr:MAG TPA: AT hook containing protein [Siphoviridae sp. ctES717]DAX01523.1 MAG TPA: AT hook containing protein [Bacteriophage sp.]